ncbi:PREDICTED: lachesin-like [Dinoponera quadriceps]|uniref:Lachesin-like n=1 Tax=Dinoponera quadriceps TaxID=609295 RepID=A0A6P3WZ74_DINQU|nr:PREDICTED: lachesin-like [Dinoponera quadriceps]XP_014471393.1 PREDICTED: lachesin-like [Dinoponera quadriceps]
MAYGLPYGMASRNVALCIIFIAALLHVSLGQTPPKSEVLPEFLALLENHTVTQGRDVSFTCVVNHLQSYKVAWIKSDSRAILAIHTHMVAHNPRLSVTHNGHNTWKLHVTNVQPNDSGTYMCQVNTDPMRSQTGHMKVVIPPDIMDLDDTADQLTTRENGDLRLRCLATGTPAPVVIWRREDGRNITLRNEHGVKRMRTYEGEQLHLRDILRQEMGSYLCIASNGVPPSVSKRYYVNVRFQPLIKVSNQLVAAPVDSDVLLQCYVESSPKALNTWHRNNGVKLLEDEKHDISEVTINDYAYQLNLTVRRLDRSDFGTYTCTAENAYGRADGTIRLQELHLPRPTVTSTSNTEVIEKHTWRKQTEKKGKKYSYVVDKPDSELKNVGHTTPMSRRNVSSPSNVTNKSRMSVFPAPAPAPAHSAPTQSGGQNGVRSSHDSRLRCVGLALAVLVILARSD